MDDIKINSRRYIQKAQNKPLRSTICRSFSIFTLKTSIIFLPTWSIFLKGENMTSLRQRRRVFDEAVGLIVSQSNTKDRRPDIFQEREIRNFEESNIQSCSTIIMSALGCTEQSKDMDGVNEVIVISEDDQDFLIRKSQFRALIERIPKNKEIKNNLWKAFVKKNKKSLTTLLTA